MKNPLHHHNWYFLTIFFIFLTGCSPAVVAEDPNLLPSLQSTEEAGARFISESPFPETGVIYQWAISAEASSEFSNPEWSAEQSVGLPDSPGCGDYQFSWASAASDSIDTLTVKFSELVIPQEIIIHQSFNPDQISKVEVQDPESQGYYTVLHKNPLRVDRPCPFELVVPVEGIDFFTNTVRITVDQSQLGLGWNEIDAVQLIGIRGEN
ncbi:MAG: hypothetical protein V3R33_10370 [Anaerolineales bacterium]